MTELSQEIQDLNTGFKSELQDLLSTQSTTQARIHWFLTSLFKATAEKGADWTLVNELWSGLGKGVNKKAIKDWIIAFTPLVFNTEENCFKRTKKAKWDLVKINEGGRNKYYEWDKPAPARKEHPIDAAKKYASLERTIIKMIEEFNTADLDTTKLEAIKLALAM